MRSTKSTIAIRDVELCEPLCWYLTFQKFLEIFFGNIFWLKGESSPKTEHVGEVNLKISLFLLSPNSVDIVYCGEHPRIAPPRTKLWPNLDCVRRDEKALHKDRLWIQEFCPSERKWKSLFFSRRMWRPQTCPLFGSDMVLFLCRNYTTERFFERLPSFPRIDEKIGLFPFLYS